MSLLTFGLLLPGQEHKNWSLSYDLQKVVECQDIQVTIEFWNNKYIVMALFFLDCIKTHTYYKMKSKNVSYFALIRVLIKHQLQPKSRSFKVTLLAFWSAFAWWPHQGECFGVDMTLCHMASKQLILRKNLSFIKWMPSDDWSRPLPCWWAHHCPRWKQNNFRGLCFARNSW